MNNTINTSILNNLMVSPDFVNEFLNLIEPEYFETHAEKAIFTIIKDYWGSFKQLPSKASVGTKLQKLKNITEEEYKGASTLLVSLPLNPDPSDWLFAAADEWIQERAFYCALVKIINQISGSKDKRSKTVDPVKLMQEALDKRRNQSLGLALSDVDAIHQHYQRRYTPMPFLLNTFNLITDGGLIRKRMLNIVAPTGVGKTLFMCNFAAEFAKQGYNVVYVTFEMPPEDIIKRIDANLLDVPIDSLSTMSIDDYKNRKARLNLTSEVIVRDFKQKTQGIKEIVSLLNGLKRRKQQVDILMVDYLTICGSAYYEKPTQYVPKHTVVSSVAEELVQVCKDFDVAGITAQQMNREGMKSSAPGMEHVADSIAAIHPMDAVVVVTEGENSKDMLKVSVVKNRHGEKAGVMVQVDYPRMKLLDIGMHKKGSADIKARLKAGRAAGGTYDLNAVTGTDNMQ
jgi:replicative DNA helicase